MNPRILLLLLHKLKKRNESFDDDTIRNFFQTISNVVYLNLSREEILRINLLSRFDVQVKLNES